MKKTLFGLLCAVTTSVFAHGPIWYPHPSKNMSEEDMLKRNLSFILTHSRSAAGLEFISLNQNQQYYIFDNVRNIDDYKNRIGASNFRSFNKFFEKMYDMAHEIPDGNVVFNASTGALIKTSYFFKRMKDDMGQPTFNFDQSFNNIQVADYRKSTQKYHDMALNLCSGDISDLNMGIGSLPRGLVDLSSRFLTGRNCEQAIKRDILEIVNPYDNPISASGDDSQLEGTSIFLAKKLIPDTNYEGSTLYKALLKTKKISKINAVYNLHDALKAYLKISSIDVIRLINLANHNHGLEFFVLNAIIDLTHDENKVVPNTKEVYSAINHLYKIIDRHDRERRNHSRAEEDHLDRKYHFWGGAFVTCELMTRGYNKYLASTISTKLGQAYEQNTSGTSAQERRGMQNDIRLHQLGAAYGREICN